MVRPGGRVGIFDSDFSTLAFNHPNPAQGRAYDDAIINALVTNPRIMRQMPRAVHGDPGRVHDIGCRIDRRAGMHEAVAVGHAPEILGSPLQQQVEWR